MNRLASDTHTRLPKYEQHPSTMRNHYLYSIFVVICCCYSINAFDNNKRNDSSMASIAKVFRLDDTCSSMCIDKYDIGDDRAVSVVDSNGTITIVFQLWAIACIKGCRVVVIQSIYEKWLFDIDANCNQGCDDMHKRMIAALESSAKMRQSLLDQAEACKYGCTFNKRESTNLAIRQTRICHIYSIRHDVQGGTKMCARRKSLDDVIIVIQ